MAQSLVDIAGQLKFDIGQVETELGDAVFTNAGLVKVVDDEVSAAYILKQRARREAQERRQAERMAQVGTAAAEMRRRVRNLAAQQEVVDNDVPALAQMLSRDPNNRLARASRVKDELLRRDPDAMVMHKIERD